MAARKKNGVDYAQLNVFSSVMMFDSAPKKKGKFYEVERVIESRNTSKDYEYLLKWTGYPLDSCTWEPSHNLKPDLLTSYKNPPKPTSERLERASRNFLSGIVSALKGKCIAPVYISMELDVWRYIVNNKGTASQHKGFMLYEKGDLTRFETLPFHCHYYLNMHGEGSAVDFPIKIKPVLSWIPSHYILGTGNKLQMAPRIPVEKIVIHFAKRQCGVKNV